MGQTAITFIVKAIRTHACPCIMPVTIRSLVDLINPFPSIIPFTVIV